MCDSAGELADGFQLCDCNQSFSISVRSNMDRSSDSDFSRSEAIEMLLLVRQVALSLSSNSAKARDCSDLIDSASARKT